MGSADGVNLYVRHTVSIFGIPADIRPSKGVQGVRRFTGQWNARKESVAVPNGRAEGQRPADEEFSTKPNAGGVGKWICDNAFPFDRERPKRIMLCAHWDTRHIADRDEENPTGPIDGANDGASGVGVLLEIARHLSQVDPDLGIDLIFFDAEDYGSPQLSMGMTALSDMDNSWCLGSQFWAKNPPITGYKPQFGILLDMVGGEFATFPKEGFSLKYANPLVQAIWNKAQNLGYGNYFINRAIGGITDDHKYINEIAGIPTVDIIHYNPNKSDFGVFHHTHQDNITIINKNTMVAVGSTCMEIIYQGL